jgi:hypothetical protein
MSSAEAADCGFPQEIGFAFGTAMENPYVSSVKKRRNGNYEIPLSS